MLLRKLIAAAANHGRGTACVPLMLVVAASAAASILALMSPAPSVGSAGATCGWKKALPEPFAHVIWIWMENHSYNQIIGNQSAPYINSLARACGLATNYTAVSHPSLPNYLAATSGATWRISDDGPPQAHPLPARSIFQQASSARSYEESMPGNCDQTSSGEYAVKHNPEAYYAPSRTACNTNDVPLGPTSSGPFAKALKAGALPEFSFVTPNLCNDMHDCSIQTGDNWLKTWVTKITTSRAYQAGGTVLFITWDENNGAHGNKVPTIIVSPTTTPGTQSSRPFTHYSLLRTTEELLAIPTRLGRAAKARSMRTAFGL
jgi:phosphatidylinositol-3-phosphatase